MSKTIDGKYSARVVGGAIKIVDAKSVFLGSATRSSLA